jgi:methionyl-tRNA formyltransferase
MTVKSDTTFKYIFASSRQWHRPYFEELERDMPASWVWVSDPIELQMAIERSSPKFVFFVHWNWLVPKAIWQHYECVCFHMTDVPYGRGGSPLQNLIVLGHTCTKLTALRMVEEVDAGPVYIKRDLDLIGTAQQIYLKAGALSAEIIRWIIGNQPEPELQIGEVTLFSRRTPKQSRLPKSGSLKDIYDLIRMLDADGYPHTFLEYGQYYLQFRNANYESDQLTAQVTIKKINIETKNDC